MQQLSRKYTTKRNNFISTFINLFRSLYNQKGQFKEVFMANTNSAAAGVYQLENGYCGYRFILTVNGKKKAQKRVKHESGKPFKT